MIDYFAANLWQLWVLVTVVCLILELTSGDLFILCFSIGALVTAVLSAFGLGFYGQLAVFVVASVLSLLFVRPSLVRRLHGRKKERLSNADALIGRIGRVSEAIEQGGYGRVAIDGDDWKAVSSDGTYVPMGQNVRVVGRESIIITVEKA
ncbi:NfeD family protein [Marseilla massiliensis]|uniref:NfeD family protein n=1 Tax=Marseilla massiliensis TaxID=1841864 RepID=A0A939B844_9BACT|nr:NfeD family protein [Marseilla massiliensis]MBM6674157.1 NfeD family protein [Marseilla massiliensis]CCY65650.1 membrane protein implicated in regulation of membrane protease activity [Prevotella sp. CAG:1124]